MQNQDCNSTVILSQEVDGEILPENCECPVVVTGEIDESVSVEPACEPYVVLSTEGPPGPTGPTGPQGPAGPGVPTGGTTGQILEKRSNADYDSEWVTPAPSGVTSFNTRTGAVTSQAGDYNTDMVPEGSTNLYFTSSRVLAVLLAGLSTATSAAITASDSIIIAFGKIQAQINGVLTSLGFKAPIDSPNFTGVPTAPTAAPGTDTTQIATTEFVETALSTGYVTNSEFSLLERQISWDVNTPTPYEKFTYDVNGNLTHLDIYTDDTLSTVVFNKTFTYDVNGNLSTLTVYQASTATSLVNTFNYDGGGNLESIQVS